MMLPFKSVACIVFPSSKGINKSPESGITMQARFIKFIIAIIGIFTSIFSFSNTMTSSPKIAIIIDDIGYRKTDFSALSLEGQFTYSVVPYAPYTQTIANAVYNSQREVMAHVPMEAIDNNHLLGKGALRVAMSEQETRQQIRDVLDNIPNVSGINNHMGSYFTTQSKHLGWLMDELSQRQLYFLDSKTTAYSMAERVAVRHGIRTGHRHVFLDNQLDNQYLTKQFNKLIAISKRYKYAIAIAHPHPQSIAFLREKVETLKSMGIELVPVSRLLPEMTRVARAKHLEKSGTHKRFINTSVAMPQ